MEIIYARCPECGKIVAFEYDGTPDVKVRKFNKI